MSQSTGESSEGGDGTSRTRRVGNGHFGQELGERRERDRHDTSSITVMQTTEGGKREGEEERDGEREKNVCPRVRQGEGK